MSPWLTATLRHSKDDLPSVSDDPNSDLDQLELDRPLPHLRRKREPLHEVEQIVDEHSEFEPDGVRLEAVARTIAASSSWRTSPP